MDNLKEKVNILIRFYDFYQKKEEKFIWDKKINQREYLFLGIEYSFPDIVWIFNKSFPK